MSINRTFKRTPKPYVKRMRSVQADANMVPNVSTQSSSVNGVSRSGTPYRTDLQYGRTSSFKSVTSQNGGVSVISISDKAKAVLALSQELKDLEKLQLEVGEQMAKLVFDQMRLAEKCRIINSSMEALIK